MGRSIHFILNPNAGSGSAASAGKSLSAYCKENGYQAVLHTTTHAGHATTLAAKLRNGNDPVVAIGGDGTVREVAAGLIGGAAPLGIIPCGSGNGLARHLGIPMNPLSAFRSIMNGRVVNADVIYAGEQPFLNIAGLGFDGLIAHEFNAHGKRGLINYIRLIIRHYFRSSEFKYELNSEEFNQTGMAFIIALANGSQYGNNAWIASGAALDDGLMDVIIVRKPTLTAIPLFLWQVMTGRVNRSRLVNRQQVREVRIKLMKSIPLHLDGEAAGHAADITFTVSSESLKLMVPA